MARLALTGTCIYSPFQLLEDGVILICDSKIEAVGPAPLIKIPAAYRQIPLEGFIVTPGFIDIHFHSNGNASVMDGSAAGLAELARFQATHGVTSFLATALTAPLRQLTEVVQSYAELNCSDYKGARCLGLNLEEPFMTSEYTGNYPAEQIRFPSYQDVVALQRKCENGIKALTMAPEAPEALEAAVQLYKEGIIPSIGRSKADYETVIRATMAGFSGVSHCFQDLRLLNPREPGVIGGALTLTELMVEMVCDGIALHPAIVNILWRLKGPDGLILVSDYMGPVEQKSEQRSISVKEPCGGLLTIEKSLPNFLATTRCKITEALRMVTYNPAKYLGINKRKGSLYPGKDADIVVLTSDFDVVMTMVQGETISGLISI